MNLSSSRATLKAQVCFISVLSSHYNSLDTKYNTAVLNSRLNKISNVYDIYLHNHSKPLNLHTILLQPSRDPQHLHSRLDVTDYNSS